MPISPLNPKTAADSSTVNQLLLQIDNLALTVEQMQQVLAYAQQIHSSEVAESFDYSVSFTHSQEEYEDVQGAIKSPTAITREIAEVILLPELQKNNKSVEWVHVSNLTRIV